MTKPDDKPKELTQESTEGLRKGSAMRQGYQMVEAAKYHAQITKADQNIAEYEQIKEFLAHIDFSTLQKKTSRETNWEREQWDWQRNPSKYNTNTDVITYMMNDIEANMQKGALASEKSTIESRGDYQQYKDFYTNIGIRQLSVKEIYQGLLEKYQSSISNDIESALQIVNEYIKSVSNNGIYDMSKGNELKSRVDNIVDISLDDKKLFKGLVDEGGNLNGLRVEGSNKYREIRQLIENCNQKIENYNQGCSGDQLEKIEFEDKIVEKAFELRVDNLYSGNSNSHQDLLQVNDSFSNPAQTQQFSGSQDSRITLPSITYVHNYILPEVLSLPSRTVSSREFGTDQLVSSVEQKSHDKSSLVNLPSNIENMRLTLSSITNGSLLSSLELTSPREQQYQQQTETDNDSNLNLVEEANNAHIQEIDNNLNTLDTNIVPISSHNNNEIQMISGNNDHNRYTDVGEESATNANERIILDLLTRNDDMSVVKEDHGEEIAKKYAIRRGNKIYQQFESSYDASDDDMKRYEVQFPKARGTEVKVQAGFMENNRLEVYYDITLDWKAEKVIINRIFSDKDKNAGKINNINDPLETDKILDNLLSKAKSLVKQQQPDMDTANFQIKEVIIDPIPSFQFDKDTKPTLDLFIGKKVKKVSSTEGEDTYYGFLGTRISCDIYPFLQRHLENSKAKQITVKRDATSSFLSLTFSS